jgi:Right handed beta helix region
MKAASFKTVGAVSGCSLIGSAGYPIVMTVTIDARRRIAGAALGLLLGLSAAGPGGAAVLEIGPDADLCGALSQLQPGDELVLQSGDYQGGCKVRQGGLPGRPIVIRSADPAEPARLTRSGDAVNMLEIHASDLVIRSLAFGPTVTDADGVRIITGSRITVEDCRFSRMGGIAVAANHSSLQGLTVRRNVITDSTATAMYFGCHDGMACRIGGLIVEGNYIRNVTAPPAEVGYGLEVKLNSAGLIRDNVIVDTKGPGIMVYGAQDLVTASVVERNFVRGSRTSSGIVVGGGPAVVRNNVSGWNFEAGIGLENYKQRGLLRAITVTHNSVYANREGGIMVPATGWVEVAILNNAASGRAGTPALPAPRPGIRLVGNLDCSWMACFANPEGLDFSPYPGSLLTGLGVARAMDGVPHDDYFGVPRRTPAAIGAIERPAAAIQYGLKR